MRQFCRLYGQLDRDEGNLARVNTLAAHLAVAEPADAAWTLHLLLGKQRRRLITARRLRQLAQRITALPEWLLEASHAQVGDTAETIALLLVGQRQGDASVKRPDQPPVPSAVCGASEPSDWPLHRWMEEELPRLAALPDDEQAEALANHWGALGCEEILVLNKLLTGAFRVGVGPGLVVKALARISGLEESLLQHRLMGEFRPSACSYAALLAPPDAGAIPASRPYPFQLASPLEAERLANLDPGDWLVEWKWDGIRGQLIRRAAEGFLWSRGEELINAAFPEMLSLAARLPEGTVLDGELLIWPACEARPRPFAALQRRLGQRRPSKRLQQELPVRFVVYDLLESLGLDQRNLPLQQRRHGLDALIEALDDPLLAVSQPLPVKGWHELEDWREQARQVGAEGVMLKALDAPYVSGRRKGLWWKHKLDPLHLDAVLLYARPGSGRRANLYTDYTFGLWDRDASSPGEPQLVSFASAYSGLSDAEIAEVDRWIRRHTSERFGPVRAVQPELVFELAFEGVQHSSRHKSGIAVRFPRISRWRRDKPAAEADTLAAALALIPP